MVKKVFLINPNFKYFPGWLKNAVNYRQLPLGLGYIGSYLRKYNETEVRICDACMQDIAEGEVLQYINAFKPDVIGISVHTPTVGFAREIALGARRLLPEAFVVFGGPHVTALPFENLDVADVSVIGEGEQTFAGIVNSFPDKSAFSSIKGIAFKNDGAFYKTDERTLIDNLDELPFPARGLFPRHTYRHHYPYRLDNPYHDTIITSRGCWHNCSFCASELMWKRRIRYRSLDNVFEEIEELAGVYNTSLLYIRDDDFTHSPDRVMRFCQRIRKYFPRLKWICQSRPEGVKRDLVREMKAAGCVEILIGVESGDDRILKNCNKDIELSAVHKASKLLKETGVNFCATFIIGNEGETRQTIEKTIDFAKEIDPTFCSFLFLVPLPGTRCFKNLLEKGYLQTHDWSNYNFHSEPIFETESLSKKLLMDLRKKAYLKFYLRPKVMFRYLYTCAITGQWRLLFSNAFVLLKFFLGLIERTKK